MSEKEKAVKFKNYEGKAKSPFMIYANFASILVPKNIGKENLTVSYTNKHQTCVVYSYGYKSVCVDDQFSINFRSYLGKDAAFKWFFEWSKKVNIVVVG